MALITCPHCGKQVSNTVKRCIHCGEPLFKEESKPTPKDFYTLEEDEQQRMEEEFRKEYPEFVSPCAKQKSAECRRKITILCRIALVAGVIFLLFRILVQTKVLDWTNNDTILMTVVPIMLASALTVCICGILAIIYLVKSKNFICRYLLYEKLFQTWLLRTKGISKTVDLSDLSKKYRKYYKKINPDLYLKKEDEQWQ